MDIVTFAHRGHMETENIDGKVKDILDTVDWDVVYNYYLIDNPTDLTNSRAWINWNGYLNNVDGYRLDWSTKYINTERVEHFINWEGRDVTLMVNYGLTKSPLMTQALFTLLTIILTAFTC